MDVLVNGATLKLFFFSPVHHVGEIKVPVKSQPKALRLQRSLPKEKKRDTMNTWKVSCRFESPLSIPFRKKFGIESTTI